MLALLSLGFQEHGVGRFLPYRLLYEALPGWQGIRVPGRLNTLTTLVLALLAAGGAARAAAAIGARRGGAGGRDRRGGCSCSSWSSRARASASTAAARRSPATRTRRCRRRPPASPELRDPLLQLPAAREDNRRYLLWSTDGFPRMLNGRTSFDPAFFNETLSAVACFPDRASVARLRRIGVRTVVVHTDLPPDPEAPAITCARSATPEQLGLQRTRRGPLVIYDLG